MSKRIKPPFWRRQAPCKSHDIVLLHPSTLSKKDRFETIADAKAESIRSEALLRSSAGGQVYAEYLSDCREGYFRCNKPFCPICARRFRRWFIGELFRIAESQSALRIFTVLLHAVPSDKIGELNLDPHRATLRKRLQRADLGDAVVIGGFEVAYKANLRAWVLHANLLVIGGSERARCEFADSFSDKQLERPVVSSLLRNRTKQLSYLLKFTTYQRPYKQNGSSRSQAVPLNRAQHTSLVKWMARHELQEFMFLFNARRRALTISI